MWAGSYWGVRYWNARYWYKIGADPVPGTGNAPSDKFTLGTKESLGITGVPTIGGWWGW